MFPAIGFLFSKLVLPNLSSAHTLAEKNKEYILPKVEKATKILLTPLVLALTLSSYERNNTRGQLEKLKLISATVTAAGQNTSLKYFLTSLKMGLVKTGPTTLKSDDDSASTAVGLGILATAVSLPYAAKKTIFTVAPELVNQLNLRDIIALSRQTLVLRVIDSLAFSLATGVMAPKLYKGLEYFHPQAKENPFLSSNFKISSMALAGFLTGALTTPLGLLCKVLIADTKFVFSEGGKISYQCKPILEVLQNILKTSGPKGLFTSATAQGVKAMASFLIMQLTIEGINNLFQQFNTNKEIANSPVNLRIGCRASHSPLVIVKKNQPSPPNVFARHSAGKLLKPAESAGLIKEKSIPPLVLTRHDIRISELAQQQQEKNLLAQLISAESMPCIEPNDSDSIESQHAIEFTSPPGHRATESSIRSQPTTPCSSIASDEEPGNSPAPTAEAFVDLPPLPEEIIAPVPLQTPPASPQKLPESPTLSAGENLMPAGIFHRIPRGSRNGKAACLLFVPNETDLPSAGI